MKTCSWQSEPCDNLCEGSTDFCPRHNRLIRKIASDELLYDYKKVQVLNRAKEKAKLPRPGIKKVGNSNTWACSDGTRVTQKEINDNLTEAYRIKYTKGNSMTCEGCGGWADSSAHIIAKARCKQIRKTELIWNPDNFFPACFECNAAIENPKGQEWKTLKNIDQCIQFIYEHDKELYFKFEVQGWQAKVKPNVTI